MFGIFAIFAIFANLCLLVCGVTSHWDKWDEKMDIETPEEKRLPYGTVCEVLWALDIAYTTCKCTPIEEYTQCVESIIGMTIEESKYHNENVLSDCTKEGAKCCDGYKNCLDLCDAQADKCISYDKYAAFYMNIKVELAAERAVLNACKDIKKVANADKADEGKKAAHEAY